MLCEGNLVMKISRNLCWKVPSSFKHIAAVGKALRFPFSDKGRFITQVTITMISSFLKLPHFFYIFVVSSFLIL
jgi:hypothetical protein